MAKGMKTGGRSKGTPNKPTSEIERLCQELQCSPVKTLIEFCMSQNEGYRFAAAKELCQYLLPKRKAIEMSLSDLTVEELAAEVEARINGSSD